MGEGGQHRERCSRQAGGDAGGDASVNECWLATVVVAMREGHPIAPQPDAAHTGVRRIGSSEGVVDITSCVDAHESKWLAHLDGVGSHAQHIARRRLRHRVGAVDLVAACTADSGGILFGWGLMAGAVERRGADETACEHAARVKQGGAGHLASKRATGSAVAAPQTNAERSKRCCICASRN